MLEPGLVLAELSISSEMELELELHDNNTYIAESPTLSINRKMEDPHIILRIEGIYFTPEPGISFLISREQYHEIEDHFRVSDQC